jgi:excinuclease UvrABC nuclease subunit
MVTIFFTHVHVLQKAYMFLFTLHTAVNAENNDCSKKHVCFLQHMNMCEKNGDHSTSVNFYSFQSCFQIELDQNNNKEALENLHTQMYQNLKLTLFFLEDLGSMILIVSTNKKPIR